MENVSLNYVVIQRVWAEELELDLLGCAAAREADVSVKRADTRCAQVGCAEQQHVHHEDLLATRCHRHEHSIAPLVWIGAGSAVHAGVTFTLRSVLCSCLIILAFSLIACLQSTATA